ncbi:MAG: FAD-binding oxidoreductase, partial [Burkholderiales bacterium]
MLPMIDAIRLGSELRRAISGEIRFTDGDRALYATDASNYRHVPIGVVVPRSAQDIIETVYICRAHEAPILMRGAGTSLAGQACNVAVVLDTSKYFNRVLHLDVSNRVAHVEPGIVRDELNRAVESEGLAFAPDPSTHDRCTIGGMIGNNSCGAHSLKHGKTAENIASIEVLTC